ncbi:hypothetical protein HOP40_07865 [Pseudonocardia broussonetiae]|uniref:Uncharacterized protein n=1 Tax=Pseudonocardia broussonetiae TaxID=2736640 RepID=A0A6M6JF53_9PSEU|nr:hypothetical protein HOP40_07865 [Pseudonocardia broussonetiae]
MRVLAERMRVCAEIAEVKAASGVSMMQPNRLAHVRDRMLAQGRAAGLSESFVHQIVSVITEESCRLEAAIIDGDEPLATDATRHSQIQAIDHIAIAVEDLETAVAELRDHYGFEVIERRSVEGEYSGMVSATMRAGGATFVVCQGTSERSNVSQYIAHRGQGVQHVALAVGDHTALLTDLRVAQADLLTGIIHAPGLDQTFTRRSTATGLQLEFISRTGGATGFEDDNVRELFESMERENVW